MTSANPEDPEADDELGESAPVRSYITPGGYAALQGQLGRLRAERPQVVETIAGLLGHKLSGVTVRYAHVPDAALVAAADGVAARIAAALEGRGSADVVTLAPSKDEAAKAVAPLHGIRW